MTRVDDVHDRDKNYTVHIKNKLHRSPRERDPVVYVRLRYFLMLYPAWPIFIPPNFSSFLHFLWSSIKCSVEKFVFSLYSQTGESHLNDVVIML